MPDNDNNEFSQDLGNGGFEGMELNLDDGAVDWNAALQELEQESKKPVTPPVKPPAAAPATSNRTPLPIAAMRREPTKIVEEPFNPKDPVALKKRKEEMLEDLQNIMVAINKATNELTRFQGAHPYLIAPNIFEMWKDELKETSVGLMREFHRARE